MNCYFVVAIISIIILNTKGQQSNNNNNNPCALLTNDVFVADLSSCENYFVCRDYQAIPGSCTPFMFHEARQTCVYEEESNCFQCANSGFKRFPIRSSCTSYIQCSGGAATTVNCPSGLNFDENIEECSLEKSCIPNICPAVDPPGAAIFIGSDTDCYTYYVCDKGELKERICPPGLHWNQAVGNCDLPSVVRCTFGPMVNCRDAVNSEYIAHPNDCNKFFICMNEEPHIQACAPNKFWDPSMNRCEFPEKVNCTSTPAKRPIPAHLKN